MGLFVIGATGRTGREVVEQALTRGHQMTAFVCSPEGIKLENEIMWILFFAFCTLRFRTKIA